MNIQATSTFRKNIEWNLTLVASQTRHAEQVKGRARSGYYKLAIIVSASIVEALVHALLVKKLGVNGEIYTGNIELYESYQLPKVFSHSGVDLAICKRRKEKLLLSKYPDFSVINKACLSQKIYTQRIYKKVDWVRKTRNKIHLQGLDHVDRSHTKVSVEKISSVINDLLINFNS